MFHEAMLCSKPGVKGKKKKQDVKHNRNAKLRMRRIRALRTTESKQDYNEKDKMRMRSSRDVQDDKKNWKIMTGVLFQ